MTKAQKNGIFVLLKNMAKKVENSKEKNFEQAMSRLKEISAEIQSSEIGLEKSIELFKEGKELMQFCHDYLENAEILVKQLSEDAEITDFEF